jgi:hypothetical protein
VIYTYYYHQKAKRRAEIAAAMIAFCRQTNDESGLRFWQYSLRLTSHLGNGGMSEDEDDCKIVRVGSSSEEVQVKVTKDLDYRHPSIAAHYEQVDATPGVEGLIFSARGKPRTKRICVSDISVQPPPLGLSTSVYRPGYLERLLPHELAALELDPNPLLE